MDWALEVKKRNITRSQFNFENVKRANMFKLIKKIIKQMKRLQNPRIMDDDRTNMEDIKD